MPKFGFWRIYGTFTLAVYATEVKNAWSGEIANEDLLTFLCDAIIFPLQLLDKNGEILTVNKTKASAIINGRENIYVQIKKGTDKPEVTTTIEKYFTDQVLPKLNQTMLKDLIYGINEAIQNDLKISKETRDDMAKYAEEKAAALFLIKSFLLSLTRSNKTATAKTQSRTRSQEGLPKELTPVPVPTSVAGIEGSYTGALLDAYGQEADVHPFTMDLLEEFPSYRKNFSRQRHLYYAAETVRRGIRDHCTEKEIDQFEVLKNEVYDGVIETWEDSYKNGLTRMSKVMQQAALLPLGGSRICRETTWVGSAQRKGVCHFLVGEGRLEGWVQEDDGEVI